MENFATIFIKEEIPQTLIEMVSIFTLDEESNIFENQDLIDFIKDYIEGSQNILSESFKALNLMSYYSDKILNLILDLRIVDIICTNVVKDYSENTRLSALYLLGDILRDDRAIYNLCKYPDFLKYLLNYFLSPNFFSVEKCQAVVYLASKIAKRLEIPETLCFHKDLMDIFILSFQKTNKCIVNTMCGTFYLMYNNDQFALLSSTEYIIANTIKNNDPSVLYFLLQILKICNLSFSDERLLSIYCNIDFQCFNHFLMINEPLLFATSNFFVSLFQRGPQFIHFCPSNFDFIFRAYNEASTEIKLAILNAFDLAFIKGTREQLDFFFNKNYDIIIFDSIEFQENVELCLDAMFAISNALLNRFQCHQEIIEQLVQLVNNQNQQKQIVDKASYLLTILTQQPMNSEM